jgi:addiction module HigA family antidote
MKQQRRRPTNPGMVLRELYLKPRGIKQAEFHATIELSAKQLSLIINGHAPITPEVAVKIGRALGTSAELWLNLQRGVDVYDAQEKLKRWKPSHRYAAPEERAQ